MFDTIHNHTTFDNDISPLLAIIEVVYRIKKPEFDNLIQLHGQELTRSKAQSDYNDILSDHVKFVYGTLSDSYIDTLSSYYSVEGIIAFIRDNLDELYTKQFEGFTSGKASYSAA